MEGFMRHISLGIIFGALLLASCDGNKTTARQAELDPVLESEDSRVTTTPVTELRDTDSVVVEDAELSYGTSAISENNLNEDTVPESDTISTANSSMNRDTSVASESDAVAVDSDVTSD